jgi:uncharacterized protein
LNVDFINREAVTLRETFDILMKLQEIDCKLRKLESIKGDLPQRLESLADELVVVQVKRDEKESAIKERTISLEHGRDEVVLLREKLKKYQTQLYQVKNNREYDAITVEIENSEKEIEALEYKGLETEEALEKIRTERDELTPQIEELQKQLLENKEILEKTLAVTRDEEFELFQKREQLVQGLAKPILSTYDRIRLGRSGMALALLKDSACSECSSRIPSQRGVEIRQMDRLFLCEVCGRIMIWSPETEKFCNPK